MQKTFRLPETTVRILVRPTIGHLLYTELNIYADLPTAFRSETLYLVINHVYFI